MSEWDNRGQDLLNQGNNAWDKGERLKAEEFFRLLVQDFPERPEGYSKVGMIMAETGRLDDAEQYFLRALTQDRNHSPALTNLGNIYLERGNIDEAIKYYLLALQNDPDYPPAHRNLSVAYKRQGRYSAYVSHFKRSQRLENRRTREAFRLRGKSSTAGERRTAPRLPSFVWLVMLLIGVALIVSVLHR